MPVGSTDVVPGIRIAWRAAARGLVRALLPVGRIALLDDVFDSKARVHDRAAVAQEDRAGAVTDEDERIVGNAGFLHAVLLIQLMRGPHRHPRAARSEERRVGKEWRTRWSEDQ